MSFPSPCDVCAMRAPCEHRPGPNLTTLDVESRELGSPDASVGPVIVW